MTRGVDTVKDVFDGCGGEGGAVVPSVDKAIVINGRRCPGIKEVGGETSKAGAIIPSVVKCCYVRTSKQWKTCKAIAVAPSKAKICR